MPRNRAKPRSGSLAHRGQVLDHPARLLDDLERAWPEADIPRHTVRYSMRTVFFDSPGVRRPPRAIGPASLRARPVDVRTRGTFRSRFEPGRHMRSVLLDEELTRRALACGRREIRKEVLFALRRTGKGSRRKRRVRRVDSSFRC